MLSKVPQVTALFWVIKILTTGMGETASDFLNHTIGPVVAVPLGFVAFSIAMVMQLRARQYSAAKYWLAVTMVSVFGTMIADSAHIGLGIPYVVTTVVFAATLTFVMITWRRREGTLSIHAINTKPRELFYWATVIVTFALGTAAGDMTAVTFGWGYLSSGIIFAIGFSIPLIAMHKFRLNEVLAFWTAYILTRPLGASFADWLGVPTSRSGLGLGTGLVTLVLAAIIAALVAFIAITGRDKPENGTQTPKDPDGIRVSRLSS